ncbi:MAG: fatty acid desaturase [Kiloniellales bacterium]|nr:fatty acid desaturase [Kiloniellales bacterium]
MLLHVVVAALAIHLAFTIWHEAVHRNVFRSTWANNVVGVVGMFPYMTPYFMQRWIHLQHHTRLNEIDDPNRIYAQGSFWKLPLRYPQALGYAKKLLDVDPRAPLERRADLALLAAVVAVYAAGAWAGALLDLLLLWFLPVVIAKVVMDWYINYLPHVGLPASRYGGTRVVDVPWFTPLVLGHNYHAIHHLWPTIPWHRYRAVFREKLSDLRRHGVPIEHRVFGPRGEPAVPLSENPLPR